MLPSLGPCVIRSVHLHGLRDCLLSQIGEVFSNYLLKDTFYPFFSNYSGAPIMQILFCLDWSHSSLNILSFLEILLSLCLSFSVFLFSDFYSINGLLHLIQSALYSFQKLFYFCILPPNLILYLLHISLQVHQHGYDLHFEFFCRKIS